MKIGSAHSAWAATMSHWVEAGSGILQRRRAMKRHPGSILQQGNHAGDRRIVLLLARPHGWRGGKDDAAQIATQLLQIIDLGAHGGLADQPHHHARATRLVNRARLALWARIARRKRWVR